jgi:hypothetical protein
VTGYGEYAAEREPAPPDRQPPRAILALLGGCAVIGALLSPLAGWLWVTLADPPQVPLAAGGGIFLGEEALDQRSGITMWFFVIGLGLGAVAGLAVGWWGRRFGWLAVVGVLVLCGVATLASRYLGVHVFGSDPSSEAAGASVGDLIRIDVSLETWVAYLGWPIGGLLGALAAISAWGRASPPG